MTTEKIDQGNLLWRKVVASFAGTVAFAFASIAVGATTSPYNPDHLGNDQVAQVAGICQTAMGLSPKEPPVFGIPLGDPHLDRNVSHYQVCIASLSDSLQSLAESRLAQQADQECRAEGDASHSPELAACVLQRVDASPKPGAANASNPTVGLESAKNETRAGDFFDASPHETRRREEVACARIGLEPPYGAFANCVKLLSDNFYAIDNPII
jgi:hypothetical protein